MATLNVYKRPLPVTSGATFAQLQAGGLGGVLDLMIAANPALTPPTVAATVNTGTASAVTTLPSGTYYVTYTWANDAGETTDGTAHAAESSVFTIVSSTTQPRVTIPALPTGATHANIYLTAANGAVTTEVLYASGIVATTYDLTGPTFGDSTRTVPTTNTTAYSNTAVASLIKSWSNGDDHKVFLRLAQHLDAFLRGDPMTLGQAWGDFHKAHVAIAALDKALDDIGVLIFANPGTIDNAVIAAGMITSKKRTFP